MEQVENHFYEMKGNVGMSLHEKERKQEDAYTKTQTHSYPIPTSLFLSSPQCISCYQFNVKMFFLCLMHSQQTKLNSEQRCRDGVMNEFVSWCRSLCLGVGIFLFAFFFMQ